MMRHVVAIGMSWRRVGVAARARVRVCSGRGRLNAPRPSLFADSTRKELWVQICAAHRPTILRIIAATDRPAYVNDYTNGFADFKRNNELAPVFIIVYNDTGYGYWCTYARAGICFYWHQRFSSRYLDLPRLTVYYGQWKFCNGNLRGSK